MSTISTNPEALAAPQGQPKPQPNPAPADPNDFHERLVYLAVDMIKYGGHQNDVNDFIRALAQHQFRAHFGDVLPDRMPDVVTEWLGYHQAGCVPRPTPEAPPASEATATSILRSSAIATLVGEIEGFLKDATPEEVHLLEEVLNRRAMNLSGLVRAEPFAACPLAESFDATLSRDESRFMKIPRELESEIADKVKRYVQSARRDAAAAQRA